MKDAKGHGSNARGAAAAHATGVDQVGRIAPVAISSLEPTQSLRLESYDDPDDMAIINHFREQIRSGQQIDPPIKVFPSGQIADGHHRVVAALAENKKEIRAETIPYDYYQPGHPGGYKIEKAAP